jgi:protein TonB
MMIPLLMLASISPMLAAVGSGAPDTSAQIVRDEKNGEFIWKYYPRQAFERGEQGRVGFRITIDRSGTISRCDVTQSSGFPLLDSETCEIMTLYAHLKPVRNAEGRLIRAQQDGFISWRLPPGGPKVASAPVAKIGSRPDAIICRKDTSTGSTIATTKQCMTSVEWERSRLEMRDHWEDLQGKGGGVPGG